jgi:hypothetical protein
MPFHAAGIHRAGLTETAYHRAVSSYAPSIKTLAHAHKRAKDSETMYGSLLVVSMPTTPAEEGQKAPPRWRTTRMGSSYDTPVAPSPPHDGAPGPVDPSDSDAIPHWFTDMLMNDFRVGVPGRSGRDQLFPPNGPDDGPSGFLYTRTIRGTNLTYGRRQNTWTRREGLHLPR